MSNLKTEATAGNITVVHYTNDLSEVLVGTIDVLNPEVNGKKMHSYLAWALEPDCEDERGVREAFWRGLVYGGIGVYLTDDAELCLPKPSSSSAAGGLTDDMADLRALMTRRCLDGHYYGDGIKFAYALNAEKGLTWPMVVSVPESDLTQEAS